MLFMIFSSFQKGTPVPFEPFESAYRIYSDDYQKLAPSHLRPKTPDELSRTTQMENQRLSESEYKQNEVKPLTKSLSSQPVEDNGQMIACEAASDVRSQPGDGASPVLVENDKGPQSRKGSLPSQSSNTTSHFTADGDTNSPSPAEGVSDQSGLEISDDEGSQTLTDQKAEVSKDVLPLPIRVTENTSFDRDTTPAGTGSFSLRTLESAYSTDEEQLGLTAINNSNTSQSQSQSLTSGSGTSDPSDVATSSANTTSDQSPTTNDTATQESKDTVGRLIEQLERKIEEKPNQAPVIQAKTPAKVEEPPKEEQQKDEKISVTVTDVTTGGTTTTGSATTSETHSSTSIGTTSLGSKYSSSAFILDETDHVMSAQPPMNSQTASLSPETKSSNDLSTVPEKQEKVHELPTPVEIQNEESLQESKSPEIQEPQKLVPGSENLAQGQTHPPEFGHTVPEEETVQMERVKQIRSSSPRAENNSSDPNMSSGGSVFTNQQFDQLSEDNSASYQNFVASQNTSKDSRSIRSGLENAQIRKGPDSSVGGTITPESLSDLSDPSSTTPDFADKTLVSDTRSPSEISRDDKGQRQRTLPYYDVSSSSKSKKYANVRNVGSNKSITKPVNEENQEDILADQNVPPEKMDNKESAALVASPSNRTQVSELQQQQDLNSKEGLSDGTTTFVKEPLTTKASDSASIRTAHLKRVRTGSKSKQSTPAPSLKSSMNIRTNADETSSVPESLTITASAISPINASTTGEVRKAELKTYESESNRQSEPVMRSIHEDSGEKRYLRRKSSGSLEYEYSFIGKHDYANLSGMSRNERSKILTDEEKYELDNRVLKVQIESPIHSDNKVATVETNSVISERNLDKNQTAYENLTATKGKESTDYFTDDKVGKLKPISLTLSSESEAIVSTKVSAEPKVISSEMELKREASGHKSQTSESWLDTETGDKIKLPASRKYVKTLDDMKNSDRSFMTESHRSSDQSQDQSESWLDTATGKSEYATSRNQMSQNAMDQNDNLDNDDKSVSAVRSKNTEQISRNSLVVSENQNGFTKKLEDKNQKLESKRENQSLKTKQTGSNIETADFSEGQNKKATVGKTSSRTGSHQTQSRESLLDIKSTSYSRKSRSAVQSTASRSALRTVSTYDNSSNPTDTSVKSRTDQEDPVGNVEQTSQLDSTASRSAIHTLATDDKSSKLKDTSVKSRTEEQDPTNTADQTSQLGSTASPSALRTVSTNDGSSKPTETSVKSRTNQQDPTVAADQTSQLGSTVSRSALRTVSTYDGSSKPTYTSVKSRTNQQDPTITADQTSQLDSTASRSAIHTLATDDKSSKLKDTSVKSRTEEQDPTNTADHTSQLGSTVSRSALRTVSTYDGSSKPTYTSVKSRTNQQDPTITADQTSQLGSTASRSALRTVSTYDESSKPTDTSVKSRTKQQDPTVTADQTSQLGSIASRSAIHTLATNDKSSKLMDTSVKSRTDQQDPVGNVEQTSQLDTTASRSALRTVSTYDRNSKPTDTSVKTRTDQQDPAGNAEQTSQLDTTASRSAMRTVSTFDRNSKPMDSSVKSWTDQQKPTGVVDQLSQLDSTTSRSAMRTVSTFDRSSKPTDTSVSIRTDEQDPAGNVEQTSQLDTTASRSAMRTVSTYDRNSKPTDTSVKTRTDQQDPAGNAEQTSQLDTTASRSAMRTVSTFDRNSKPTDTSVKTRTDQQDPAGNVEQTSQLDTTASRSAMRTVSTYDISSKPMDLSVKSKTDQQDPASNAEQTSQLDTTASRSAMRTVSTYDRNSKPTDTSVKTRTDQQNPAGNAEQTSQLDTTASRSAMRTVSTFDRNSKPTDTSVKTRTDQQDPTVTADETSQLNSTASRSVLRTVSTYDRNSKPMDSSVKTRTDQQDPVGTIDQTSQLGTVASRSAMQTLSYVEASSKAISATVKVKHQQPDEHLGSLSSRSAVCTLSSNEKNYLPMEKSVRTNLTRSSSVAETSQNLKTKSDGPSGVSVTRSIVKSSQNSRNKNKPNSEISKREAGQNFVDDENERSFLAGTPAVQSISRSEGGSRPASVNSFDTYSHSARGHEDVVSNSPYREIEIDRLDVHSERNSRAHESSYGTVSEPIGADMNDEYYGSGGDITLHESLASRSAITPMHETVSDGKNSSDNTYSWLASTSQTPESTITDFKTAKPETSLSTTESVAERDAMTPMERLSDYGDSEEDHDFLPTESRDVWSSEKNNKTELQTVPSTAESRSKVQSGSKASQRTMSLTEHMTEVSQANQSNRLYSEYTRRKQQKEPGRNEGKSPDYTGRNTNSDFRSHSRSSSVLQTKTPSFGGSRKSQSSKDRTKSSLGTRNELETESRSRKKTESAATNDSSSFPPSASAVQTMTSSISNPKVNNSSKNSSLELKNDQLTKTNSEKDSTNIVRTVAFDEEPSGDGSITLRNDIDTDYQELAQGQRIKSSPNDTKADSNYNSYYYIRVPEEKSSEGKQSQVSFETSGAFSNTAVDSIPSGRSNRTKTTVYTKPFSPTSSDRISNIADLSHADSNDSDYNTLQVKTATSPKATKGPKTPRSSNLAMSPNPLKSPKTVKTSVVRPVNEEYPITPRNSFADQKSQRSQESLLSSRPGTPTPRIDIQSTTAPSRGRLESTGRRTQSQESIDEVEVEDEESMSGPQGAEWTEDVASSLPPSIQSGKTSSRKVNSDLANTVITEVSRKFIICSSSKKKKDESNMTYRGAHIPLSIKP